MVRPRRDPKAQKKKTKIVAFVQDVFSVRWQEENGSKTAHCCVFVVFVAHAEYNPQTVHTIHHIKMVM